MAFLAFVLRSRKVAMIFVMSAEQSVAVSAESVPFVAVASAIAVVESRELVVFVVDIVIGIDKKKRSIRRGEGKKRKCAAIIIIIIIAFSSFRVIAGNGIFQWREVSSNRTQHKPLTSLILFFSFALQSQIIMIMVILPPLLHYMWIVYHILVHRYG